MPRIEPIAPPRCQPLVVVLAAFVAGIVADRAWPLAFGAWWITGCIVWLLWLGCFRSKRERLALALQLASLALVGASWHHCCWQLFLADDLGRFAREEFQPVCVEVIAGEAPRYFAAPPFDPLRTFPATERSVLAVHTVGIRDVRTWRDAAGASTLVVSGTLDGVQPGDRLEVFAQLAAPRSALNPGEFDRAEFSRADRQLSFLRTDFNECVRVVEPASSWNFERWLGRVRLSSDRLLSRLITPGNAGLAAGLILGQREQIGEEQVEPYFTTGTLHVLVVSGMHVAILAWGLMFIARLGFMPRRWALAGVVALVVVYSLLTGGNPPIVRAAVLVAAYCLARVLGRQPLAFNTLALAALVVLAWNPAELFRTGPQLSFLAVSARVWVAQWRSSLPPLGPLERLIADTRPWPERKLKQLGGWAWELTLASTIVWLVVTPLVMNRFHLFSPAGVVLGPVLWPPVTLALLTGFALLAFGWIPVVGPLLGRVCDLSIGAMQWLVDGASRIPGNHLWTPGPALWWVVGFYLLLAAAVAFPLWRPRRMRLAAIGLLWLAAGFVPSLLRERDELRTTFIAVDHGLSVLVELPGGEKLLYDAGRLGMPETPARSIAAVLWSRGITHLDAVVISHADADHYNAMPELLKRFSVGVVYVSPMMFERQTPALTALRTAIEKSGSPLREVWSGDKLRVTPGSAASTSEAQQATIEILHPPRQGVLGSDNANSIVLNNEYANRRLLLTGDLESPGLEDVTAEDPLDVDVLLAPHHGSRFSDPPGFAAWSTPEHLIISGGHGNDLESVHESYTQLGAKVWHTAKTGAIEFVIKGNGEIVTTERK